MQTIAEYLAKLAEPEGQQSRELFCSELAKSLDSAGRSLWSFGLSAEPEREGLALVVQMAASLTQGAVLLYSQQAWYAGASIVRQLVESEYLLFLMSSNPTEAAEWRKSTHEQRRKFFSPAQMRKRSGGRFRTSEYEAHCERGGHPSPLGAMFLAEHQGPLRTNIWLWVDLAQHLVRLWPSFEAAVERLGLAHIAAVAHARTAASFAITRWQATDPCCGWVTLEGAQGAT